MSPDKRFDGPSIRVSIETKNDRICRVVLSHHDPGFIYQVLGRPKRELIDRIALFINHYLNGRESHTLAFLPSKNFSLFTQKVLHALNKITFGHTLTYGNLASQIGQPKAARAVGSACGRNPIPFFIPCHRVVSTRSIGGFALDI